MAKWSVNEIRERAVQIVNGNLGGIRYIPLVDRIEQESPETGRGAIRAAVYDLQRKFPQKISKPSRGLFKPLGAAGDETGPVVEIEQVVSAGVKFKESDFYQQFADWLKDQDEVIDAAPIGGACMRSKWGTPDVVGVYKPLAANLIEFPPEIVSAEIKIKADAHDAVVAFGQAVAYRLFSTKTYIAMPRSLMPDEQDRLKSLCTLFGVGLVMFDVEERPTFTIEVTAQRYSPDMFYVNDFADRLKLSDADLFEKLFR
jgi:hypothetical protein